MPEQFDDLPQPDFEGTVAVDDLQNGRDYVGFELDEEGAYKPIIERRIGEAKRQREASVNAESDTATD